MNYMYIVTIITVFNVGKISLSNVTISCCVHNVYLPSRFLDGVKIWGSDGKPNKGEVRQHYL